MFKDALGMKAATEAACHFLDGYWVRLDTSPRECAEAVVDAYLETAPELAIRADERGKIAAKLRAMADEIATDRFYRGDEAAVLRQAADEIEA
jgi:hypothetical protein